MFVFAGLGKFLGMDRLSDVMDGSAEADEVGVELRCRKFSGDAVDQNGRSVVDENEVRQETRRRRDLLENAQGFLRQRSVLAGGERIRLSHPCRMQVLIESS